MRGLVTAGRAVRRELHRVSRVERGRPSSDVRLLIAASRVAPRAATAAAWTKRSPVARGQSMTARDQHQPASSRAMATLAMTGRLQRRLNLTQRSCSRRLPSVAAGTGGGWGQFPPVAHGLAGRVAGAVVPGGFDQQAAGVGVAGLGDRALHPGRAGGVLGRDQADERADAVAGEAVPVADLDGRARTRSACEIPRRQPSRRTTGVNSLSPAISAIAVSSRSPARGHAQHGCRSRTRTPAALRRRRSAAGAASGRARRSRPARRSRRCPWRSSSLDSRCRARIRSPRQSSRARTRSRAAS